MTGSTILVPDFRESTVSIIDDQISHKVGDVDPADCARIENRTSGGRRRYLVWRRFIFINQTIRPNDHPLDSCVVLSNLEPHIVRGLRDTCCNRVREDAM
jgi:hypothetical protein